MDHVAGYSRGKACAETNILPKLSDFLTVLKPGRKSGRKPAAADGYRGEGKPRNPGSSGKRLYET